LTTTTSTTVSIADIQAVLQSIAIWKSKEYNCSISIAFKSEAISQGAVAAASGVADFASGRPVEPADKFVWGSVTKVLTGASVLKLVSEGKFGLDDKVYSLLDSVFAQISDAHPEFHYRSLHELWPNAHFCEERLGEGSPAYVHGHSRL